MHDHLSKHVLRVGCTCSIKFQELQEAWDHQECTSTVSVPIPASRVFEDAFIPYHDRHLPLPERGTCPVLYAANGTVGVLHFGLLTEDVKLNGRLVCAHICQVESFDAVMSLWRMVG